MCCTEHVLYSTTFYSSSGTQYNVLLLVSSIVECSTTICPPTGLDSKSLPTTAQVDTPCSYHIQYLLRLGIPGTFLGGSVPVTLQTSIFAHFSFDTRQHCHLSLTYFVVIPESIDYELTGSRSIRIGEFRSRADTPSDPNEA